MIDAKVRKELFDGGSLRQIDELFGTAKDLFQAPEKKHFDANGRGCGGHKEIVAQGAQRGIAWGDG